MPIPELPTHPDVTWLQHMSFSQLHLWSDSPWITWINLSPKQVVNKYSKDNRCTQKAEVAEGFHLTGVGAPPTFSLILSMQRP